MGRPKHQLAMVNTDLDSDFFIGDNARKLRGLLKLVLLFDKIIFSSYLDRVFTLNAHMHDILKLAASSHETRCRDGLARHDQHLASRVPRIECGTRRGTICFICYVMQCRPSSPSVNPRFAIAPTHTAPCLDHRGTPQPPQKPRKNCRGVF